jgi:long-subunit acyl-CoA synthetase (AMP-forming)
VICFSIFVGSGRSAGYTSGTTGMPKGAILSHRLLASVAISNQHDTVPEQDGMVMFSFLPLSHIYARPVPFSFGMLAELAQIH